MKNIKSQQPTTSNRSILPQRSANNDWITTVAFGWASNFVTIRMCTSLAVAFLCLAHIHLRIQATKVNVVSTLCCRMLGIPYIWQRIHSFHYKPRPTRTRNENRIPCRCQNRAHTNRRWCSKRCAPHSFIIIFIDACSFFRIWIKWISHRLSQNLSDQIVSFRFLVCLEFCRKIHCVFS